MTSPNLRRENHLREAATLIAVVAAELKSTHPATSRALFRIVDRITKHRHRIADGVAR